MPTINKTLAILFLICFSSICNAQTKRALLIGISTYDTSKTSWGQIHGTNDVALLKTALLKKGVRKITELRNEAATYQGICSALENLIHQSEKGDIIYIHMSGHGQPVEDEDGDEKDGWDESFIPYDAHMRYKPGVYSGEHHITDDILKIYIDKIRQKIGKEGIVYVSIDACHSGESSREESYSTNEIPEDDEAIFEVALINETEATERGTYIGFTKNNTIYSPPHKQEEEIILPKGKNKSPLVMFESCLSYERSTEITLKCKGRQGNMRNFHCGLLSYTLYKIFNQNNFVLGKDVNWVNHVRETFNSYKPSNIKQDLVIERTK